MRISDWSSDVCSSDLTTRIASAKAYREAGIADPVRELDMVEVHDCFSITELVTMEDLGLSRPGEGYRDVLEGKFDANGEVRSEERRVGKECVSTCSYRWSP